MSVASVEIGCVEVFPTWETNSYGVVSLLNVLRFAAEDFWEASRILATLGAYPSMMRDASGRANAIKQINKLLEHCARLNLPVSLKEAEKMESQFNSSKTSPDSFAMLVHRLSSVIHSELDARVFFALESEKVELWHPLWLVETAIYSAFPRAWEEFRRAGRCYAYGECTAAVFHAMRVIDSGLQLVYESLGETYDARSWDGVAKKIESEMAKKYQDKSADWRQKEPFYSAVLTDIRSIGRAHRNPALHDIERRYSDHEAKYLIDVAKAFMLHLAENGMREREAIGPA